MIQQSITVIVFLSGWCLLSEASATGSDEEQIVSQMNLLHSFFNHPDPEALFDHVYTQGSCAMPPGEPLYQGRGSILFMNTRLMQTIKGLNVRSERIGIYGNLAVQVFWYEDDGAGGRVLLQGKDMAVWQMDKETNNWKLLRVIWN